MALRTILNESEWVEYLLNLGIPEKYSKEYAIKFVEQQVPTNLLQFITDNDLRETYNIQLGGHRLAILHSTNQLQTPSQGQLVTHASSSKPQVRHQAPQLKQKMTPSSFRAFVSHWTVYKSLVGLRNDDANAAAQIFSLACTDHQDIRQTIADHKPDHLTLGETEYLEMLRKLLTARATPETYRGKLFSLTQRSDESCQEWLKRLQEIAPDCEFTILCPNDHTTYHRFDETIIRTKFILGLNNLHIKQDIMAKSSELPSLDAVFNHATRMEATTQDIESMTKTIAGMEPFAQKQYSSASDDDELNRISSYRKLQKGRKHDTTQKPVSKNRPCSGCGSTQHSSDERPMKCPAWKKLCNRCKRRGHFGNVCRSDKTADTANAVIAQVNDTKNTSNEVEITITAENDPPGRAITMKALPDTGASVCVTGMSILRTLGINVAQLSQTSRRIMTATGGKIYCKGWFRGKLCIGQNSTLQKIYVCENIHRFYLSREGCIDLNIVHKNFPHPMQHTPRNTPYQLTPQETVVPNKAVPQTHPVHPNKAAQQTHLPQRPKEIPYPPTTENIPRLEKWLIEAFSKSGFNEDKTVVFPKMTGVPKAEIHVKPNAKPYFRATPNQIPHYWRKPTKDLIDQFEKRGMIRKKPIGEPTVWCFPMVITPKKSSTPLDPKLRMTVDFQPLNSQCIRELHHVESPFQLASQIPTNSYKTVLDAMDGYQAIELDEKSIPLTTFISLWGAYQFLRLPAGLIDSGDKYTSRYDLIIQHIQRKVKCVDDTLLYDSSIENAFFHTFEYLYTCASHGIVFNKKKFKFCRRDITFAGFTITSNGIKPSDSTLQALQNFPTPTSITDVRSWFGLVRQVAYAHSVSEDLAPLRGLLKQQDGKNTKFLWNEQLQQAFERSKEHITNSVREGICTFNPKRHTSLQCDWSKGGIGFLLLQKHCNCDLPAPHDPSMTQCCPSGWKLVYAGSRFTTDPESRYSPTEGEALAVAWALKTSRLFTLGCPKLMIITDHKPLLGILNERDLESIKNPRLRRLKEHTLGYDFTIKHCPGKLHIGADALSRYPARAHHETPYEGRISDPCEDHIGSIVTSAICGLFDGNSEDGSPIAITRDKVELECLKDPNYTELHSLVTSGFPERRIDVPDHAKTYWSPSQKNMLSTFGSIVLYQDRLVIPKSLRGRIIRILHSAHQGCTGMIARATTSIYWPGIRKDILSFQTNCRSCIEIAPSQPREPLAVTPLPKRPFEVICSDICQIKNRYYLIVVDRFSGFLHIFYSRTAPTHQFLEKHLRDIFVRYGRPDQLDTDGGPQYKAEAFSKFLTTWGVKHRVSSPYYPQSNGRAELGVKTAKRLLQENTTDGSINNDKVACAVLQYHNTPLRDCSMSPAQLLFGRALADFLPVNPQAYKLHPYWAKQVERSQQSRSLRHQSLARRYNIGTRKLRPLRAGQTVQVQNHTSKRWDRSAVILQVLPHRRYKLRLLDTGNVTSRNRRFLRPRKSTHRYARFSGPSPVPASQHYPVGVQGSNAPSEDRGDDDLVTEDRVRDEDLIDVSESIRDPPTTLEIHHTREPLALRRLRPHNKTGLRE